MTRRARKQEVGTRAALLRQHLRNDAPRLFGLKLLIRSVVLSSSREEFSNLISAPRAVLDNRGDTLEAISVAEMSAATTLSHYDLTCMRMKVEPHPPEETREARRKFLKQVSDKRVKNWKNTLEATRRSKQNWKMAKDERLEAERREVDKQEAALQRQMRFETIRRANDALYEQTGPMKALRSNLLYADVLEARKAQVVERRNVAAKEAEEAARDHALIMEKLKEAECRESEEKLARSSKSKRIQKIQKDQLEDFRTEYVAQLLAEQEEGRIMQEKIKRETEEEEEKARKAKVEQRHEMERMLAANASLQQIRLKKYDEDLAMTAACEKEKKVLENVARVRKTLEAKRFAARQALRQAMIDRATEELNNMTAITDKREEKEYQEQMAKKDAADAHKAMMRSRQEGAIERSRALSVRMKAERQAMESDEAQKLKDYYQQRAREVAEEDEEAKREQRRRINEIKASQLSQIEEKKEKQMVEKAYKLVQHDRIQAIACQEEERFTDIVAKEAAKMQAAGRDTYMLERVLHSTYGAKALPRLKEKIQTLVASCDSPATGPPPTC